MLIIDIFIYFTYHSTKYQTRLRNLSTNVLVEIWMYGNMNTLKYENMELWKYENSEIWKYGSIQGVPKKRGISE